MLILQMIPHSRVSISVDGSHCTRGEWLHVHQGDLTYTRIIPVLPSKSNIHQEPYSRESYSNIDVFGVRKRKDSSKNNNDRW